MCSITMFNSFYNIIPFLFFALALSALFPFPLFLGGEILTGDGSVFNFFES